MTNASSLNNQTWLITGCSTGFGRELATQLLTRGANVVVTARKLEAIKDFADTYGSRALCLELDVTKQAQIDSAIAATEKTFGRMDVLVNNAGYGYYASIEEGDEAQIRAMFDTNVFGLAAMTRAALPLLRRQKSGTVVNLSSVAGLNARPSGGYYSATKYAVEAMSEALMRETAPLGIKVLLVNPGPFRTDFAGRSLHATPSQIADYDQTVGESARWLQTLDGKQAGDPVRACAAIIDAATSGNPPTHLLLGKIVYETVTAKYKDFLAEVERNKDITIGADYPDSEAA